jgi:hypothetical protein
MISAEARELLEKTKEWINSMMKTYDVSPKECINILSEAETFEEATRLIQLNFNVARERKKTK